MEISPYLSVLLATIKEIQASHSSGEVDVAQLGTILLKESKNWSAHGFEKLSVALAQLKDAKQVDVYRNEQGVLKVRSTDPSAETPEAISKPILVEPRQPFVPLRSSIWFAFASSLKGQERMLNRQTGRVWFGEGPRPTATDWVPIEPVPEEEQVRWATEFIERSSAGDQKNALLESLKHPDWFRLLPSLLAKEGPLLIRSWSHVRSRRIIEHVKLWAQKYETPQEVLFAPRIHTALPEGPTTQHEHRPAQDLRQALLSAVSKMQTEDLLELPIPPRLLIQVVRPDLLR